MLISALNQLSTYHRIIPPPFQGGLKIGIPSRPGAFAPGYSAAAPAARCSGCAPWTHLDIGGGGIYHTPTGYTVPL